MGSGGADRIHRQQIDGHRQVRNRVGGIRRKIGGREPKLTKTQLHGKEEKRLMGHWLPLMEISPALENFELCPE